MAHYLPTGASKQVNSAHSGGLSLHSGPFVIKKGGFSVASDKLLNYAFSRKIGGRENKGGTVDGVRTE